MRCPSCQCELAQPAKFCPECGAHLPAAEAAVHDLPPPGDDPGNVVYLHPQPPTGLDVHPHAHRYGDPPAAPPAAATPPEAVPAAPHVPGTVTPIQAIPPIGAPAHPAAAEPASAAGGHVPATGAGEPQPPSGAPGPAIGEPSPHPDDPDVIWTTNVLGERVSIPAMGPTGNFFEFEDAAPREPRLLGTTLAIVSMVLMSIALAVYSASLKEGTSGALAGGFVLLASVFWAWYLTLPDEQQHRPLIGAYRRITALVDRRIDPVRERTETGLVRRRERERLEAMRRERARRVGELGELAYRQFRAGTLDPSMSAAAQRVVAIEQQMLMQDSRIADLARRREKGEPEEG